VRGKGGRSRVVRLSLGTWQEVQSLRSADALSENRIFSNDGLVRVGSSAPRCYVPYLRPRLALEHGPLPPRLAREKSSEDYLAL
jgi:hypothetical protein